MSGFARVNGELALDGVGLTAIAARFGTPCYVYSRAMIEAAFREFDAGLAGVDHLVCYAVKANSNLAVLEVLARAWGRVSTSSLAASSRSTESPSPRSRGVLALPATSIRAP